MQFAIAIATQFGIGYFVAFATAIMFICGFYIQGVLGVAVIAAYILKLDRIYL